MSAKTPKVKPGMQTRWEKTCEDIKSGKEKIEFGWSESSCVGLYVLEAKGSKRPAPFGWIWYRFETGNVLSLSMVYTIESVRNCGILGMMHEELLRWYPDMRMIVTGRATEYSVRWLKKRGYVFNKEFDRWELKIDPPKKAAKPKCN